MDQERKQNFINAFEKYIESPERLKKLMRATSAPVTILSKDSSLFHSQETIMRVLLSSQEIQRDILTLLLEKIPELLSESIDHFGPALVVIILQQLKWLDVVYDSDFLTKKIFEILDICPVDIQREIITSIPEIVNDSSHSNIVEELQMLLRGNMQGLTTSIIYALSQLNIADDTKHSVTHDVVSLLESLEIEDLPCVVKFLLNSSPLSSLSSILEDLRQLLKTLGNLKQKDTGDSVVLIIESFRDSLKYNTDLGLSFLKLFSKIDDSSGILLLDLWLLYFIHGLPKLTGKVQSILKTKLSKRLIQENMIKKSLSATFSNAFCQEFESLKSLASTFIESNDPSDRWFGENLFVSLYNAFENAFYRQDIIGTLVSHCGSTSEQGITSSLISLETIVCLHTEECEKVSAFFNLLIDCLLEKSLKQLRLIYKILCTLELPQIEFGFSTRLRSSNLLILLKKQIDNQEFKFKRMGIVGFVCLLSRMSTVHDEGSIKEVTEEGISLFHSVKRSIDSDPNALGFLCDEISFMIQNNRCQESVVQHLNGCFSDLFADSFLLPVNSPQKEVQVCNLKPTIWKAVEGAHDSCEEYLNILPLLSKGRSDNTNMLNILCPLFQCLVSCEFYLERGSLQNIDLLLYCPINMFDEDLIESIDALGENEVYLIYNSLKYVRDWFCELINAFVLSTSDHCFSQRWSLEELKEVHPDHDILAVFSRLENLLRVESHLNQIMNAFPHHTGENACKRNLTLRSIKLLSFPPKAEHAGFTMEAFLYLLSDLRHKLEYLSETGNKSFSSSYDNLVDFTFESALTSISTIFPTLGQVTRSLIGNIQNSAFGADPTETDLKCLQEMLAVFKLIATHPQFRKAKENECLRQILCAFNDIDSETSLSEARSSLFKILIEFKALKDFCPEIIENLLGLLEDMVKVSSDTNCRDFEDQLSELCFELVSFPWLQISKLPSKTLGSIVKMYLCYNSDPLSVVKSMVETLKKLTSASLEEASELEKQFPSLTKKSFASFYKAVFDTSIQICSSSSTQFAVLSLTHSTMATAFADLVEIASENANNIQVLGVSIKSGKVFMDEIVKKMTVYDKFLDEYEEEIRQILRRLQKGTRKLQMICAHCKKVKSSLISNVPPCRRTLELFIFKVKELFVKRGKGDIFTQSVLKSKNLQGQPDSDEENNPPKKPKKSKRKRKKPQQESEVDLGENENEGPSVKSSRVNSQENPLNSRSEFPADNQDADQDELDDTSTRFLKAQEVESRNSTNSDTVIDEELRQMDDELRQLDDSIDWL